ncbi:MAG: MFS transporter [Victivallales bacterium]|nr:MFS transporter [Victivallales bacterium]MCF7889168.1 MFS transporter [Victivallales bacterium]
MTFWNSLKRYSQIWYIGFSAQGGISLGLAPIFLPIIVAKYKGPSEAGIVVAMFYFAQMLSPFFGWLSDKKNWHRGVYISSYILVGLGVGIFPLFPNMLTWLLMVFLLGLGVGASNTVSEMFIVEFQPKPEWDSRVSWLQMFFGVGQAGGLFLAFLLSKDAATALYLAGLLMIPSLIIGLFQLPHTSKRKKFKRTPENPGPTGARSIASLLKHLPHFKNIVQRFPQKLHSLLTLYLTAWILVMLGNWLIYNLYPLLMANVFHLNATKSSLYFAIGSVIAVPACPISGWLAEKKGEVTVIIIGIIMSLVAALGMMILAIFPIPADKFLVPITFMFLPVAWSPLIIVGTAIVTKLSDLSQGEALGIFTAATAMSSLIAALAAGFIADSIGYLYVLILSAIVTILSLIFMSVLGKRFHAQEKEKTDS